MNLQEFIIKSSDFIDYIEQSLKKQRILLLGIANKEKLEKIKTLWQYLKNVKKTTAEREAGSSKFINIRLRNMNIIMEACFEGQKKEFFKINYVADSKKQIFSNEKNFIDLDNLIIEDEVKNDVEYDLIKSEITNIVYQLKNMNLSDKEIKNIFEQCIKEA